MEMEGKSNRTNTRKLPRLVVTRCHPSCGSLVHARSTRGDWNRYRRQIGIDCKDHRPVGRVHRMALPRDDAGLASLRVTALPTARPSKSSPRRLSPLATARHEVWILALASRSINRGIRGTRSRTDNGHAPPCEF
jgi:hypothetical protein